MKAQSGFTLIELMTVSIISTVLAGGILSMLHLGNEKIKESIALARLAKVYNIATEAVHQVASEAYTVTGNEEPVVPLDPIPGPGYSSGKSKVIFYNEALDTIGAFRINSEGYLYEWKKGQSFILFMVGADSVYVANQNNFAIAPGRKGIRYSFGVQQEINGVTYQLSSPRELVLCRNTPN